MSYIRLNIKNVEQTIHNEIHCHFRDAPGTVFTAERETVEATGLTLGEVS